MTRAKLTPQGAPRFGDVAGKLAWHELGNSWPLENGAGSGHRASAAATAEVAAKAKDVVPNEFSSKALLAHGRKKTRSKTTAHVQTGTSGPRNQPHSSNAKFNMFGSFQMQKTALAVYLARKSRSFKRLPPSTFYAFVSRKPSGLPGKRSASSRMLMSI